MSECPRPGLLQNLNLKNTGLTGLLPREMSQLATIQHISLGGNQLEGGWVLMLLRPGRAMEVCCRCNRAARLRMQACRQVGVVAHRGCTSACSAPGPP
mgnify:CR=1 FL=1